jgi:chromosome segregation ATPase
MRSLKLYFLPIGAIVLLLWCLLFASSVYGSTPTEPVTLTPQEYATLKTNFDTLESTIDSQLTTIKELEVQLKVAKLSTSEQKQELIEALNLINEQKAQLTQARNLLQKQEQMLNEQKLSLTKAEVYLNEQKKEIHKAKMKQRNSTILNYVLGTALVYTVAKN